MLGTFHGLKYYFLKKQMVRLTITKIFIFQTSTFSVGKVLSTLESEKKEDNQEEIDTDHEEGEIATDEDDDPTYCRYCDIQFDREGVSNCRIFTSTF